MSKIFVFFSGFVGLLLPFILYTQTMNMIDNFLQFGAESPAPIVIGVCVTIVLAIIVPFLVHVNRKQTYDHFKQPRLSKYTKLSVTAVVSAPAFLGFMFTIPASAPHGVWWAIVGLGVFSITCSLSLLPPIKYWRQADTTAACVPRSVGTSQT